jgi:hypothetical protein
MAIGLRWRRAPTGARPTRLRIYFTYYPERLKVSYTFQLRKAGIAG